MEFLEIIENRWKQRIKSLESGIHLIDKRKRGVSVQKLYHYCKSGCANRKHAALL